MRFPSLKAKYNFIKHLFRAIVSKSKAFCSVKKHPILIPLIAVVALLNSYVVIAAVLDTTEFTEERLLVIPETVTSESWQGIETVLVQDVGTNAIFQEFNKSILNAAAGILKEYTNNDPYLQAMWANINTKGNYNGQHTHEGELSGVFYCQVPENSGKLILVNPAVRSYISVIRNSNFPINPERLALIMFPSWLEHYVQPNESNDPRISISFNIGIK